MFAAIVTLFTGMVALCALGVITASVMRGMASAGALRAELLGNTEKRGSNRIDFSELAPQPIRERPSHRTARPACLPRPRHARRAAA